MNYIDLINSFWDSAATNPLSAGQVSLYMALLHVCNRSYWAEWFQAPNKVLSVLSGLSKSGILKARDELKQRGFIDFQESGATATSYKLLMADSRQESKQESVRESKQESAQESVRESKQESAQESVQESKQESAQESKLESKQESAQESKLESVRESSPLKDIRQKTKDIKRDIRARAPTVDCFESFWNAYPKQGRDRAAAEKAYCRALRDDCHITEQDLVSAAENYADAMEVLGREKEFIRSAASFLTDNFFAAYLPGQYERPVKSKAAAGAGRNAFNRFEQNKYDFGALEDELLAN